MSRGATPLPYGAMCGHARPWRHAAFGDNARQVIAAIRRELDLDPTTIAPEPAPGDQARLLELPKQIRQSGARESETTDQLA